MKTPPLPPPTLGRLVCGGGVSLSLSHALVYGGIGWRELREREDEKERIKVSLNDIYENRHFYLTLGSGDS